MLPRTKQEGETLTTGNVGLTPPLVTKGESPFPQRIVLVVEYHKSTRIGIHDTPDNTLDTNLISNHLDLARYRDVKDVDWIEVHINIADMLDFQNTRCLCCWS